MSDELDALMAAAAEAGEEIGDEVDIDLSEAVTFDPFTADVPVEISAAALKRAKEAPHNPYIELKLRVFEGEFEGRILYTNLNIKGRGAGFGVDKLRAFGYEIDAEKPKVSISALTGLKAVASCAPDTREEYKHKVVVGKLAPYVSQADALADEVK